MQTRRARAAARARAALEDEARRGVAQGRCGHRRVEAREVVLDEEVPLVGDAADERDVDRRARERRHRLLQGDVELPAPG